MSCSLATDKRNTDFTAVVHHPATGAGYWIEQHTSSLVAYSAKKELGTDLVGSFVPEMTYRKNHLAYSITHVLWRQNWYFSVFSFENSKFHRYCCLCHQLLPSGHGGDCPLTDCCLKSKLPFLVSPMTSQINWRFFFKLLPISHVISFLACLLTSWVNFQVLAQNI